MRWVQLCSSLNILSRCLSLGLEWKLTYSSPVATAEFSTFAGILSAALSQHHLLGFDSSTGIPSPPLALFVVMLPKAHLTSHSRMCGSRWVITPSWISGSWISFLVGSNILQLTVVQQQVVVKCESAVKVLHSICQQIWKTQQWPHDWKRSVFIPILKKGSAKECSNYCTIELISHTSNA